jgi:hypothetical protein
VYKDGSLRSSTQSGIPDKKSGPLTIGSAFNLTNFFDGAIDDVRIYNRPLSASELQDVIAGNDSNDSPPTGLTGHWGFNEGSGQTANDSSGKGHDGTLGQNSNSGSDDPTWTTGKSGTGLRFGGNDLVRIADHSDFALPAYSWAMWVKADASPSGALTSQTLSNASEQFVFSWDHTSSSFRTAAAHKAGSTWRSSRITSSLNGGAWYHIAATYDGSSLKVYLNGNLQNSVSMGRPNTTSGNLYIGSGQTSQSSPVSFFKGVIDEVSIYNRALSASEIQALASQ